MRRYTSFTAVLLTVLLSVLSGALLFGTPRCAAAQNVPLAAPATAELASDAEISYDRFERDLSFRLPAGAAEVHRGDGPVKVIVLVGRRLDQPVGEYGRILFLTRGKPDSRVGLILLADDQKPDTRISRAVQVDDSTVIYAVNLFSWNFEALARARTVEARLPNGTEVVVPSDLISRGARLITAVKDSTFVSWAMQEAATRKARQASVDPGAFKFRHDAASHAYIATGPASIAQDSAGAQLPIVYQAIGAGPDTTDAGPPNFVVQLSAKEWGAHADTVVVRAGDIATVKAGDAVVHTSTPQGYSVLLVVFSMKECLSLLNAMQADRPVELRLGTGARVRLTRQQLNEAAVAIQLALSPDRMRQGLARQEP